MFFWMSVMPYLWILLSSSQTLIFDWIRFLTVYNLYLWFLYWCCPMILNYVRSLYPSNICSLLVLDSKCCDYPILHPLYIVPIVLKTSVFIDPYIAQIVLLWRKTFFPNTWFQESVLNPWFDSQSFLFWLCSWKACLRWWMVYG